MAARKKTESETYRLDRFGNRHEITEQDVTPDPQPALPAAPND